MNMQFNSNMIGGFKTKRQKFGIVSCIFLMIFGVVFAVAGYFAINSLQIDSSWQVISGEVVDSSTSTRIKDGSTTHSAVVSYSVNGQEYQVFSSFGSSFTPTIGEMRQVAYNPIKPSQAKIVESMGTTWWLWLFPVVGIMVFVIALVSFVKSFKRSMSINRLVEIGQKVQGLLVDIQLTGRNKAYRITVAAQDNSGNVQNYVSDYIEGIGGLAMADFRNNPIPIDVYLDPANPKNYYVDISDIPNLTPQRISELIQQAAAKNTQ